MGELEKIFSWMKLGFVYGIAVLIMYVIPLTLAMMGLKVGDLILGFFALPFTVGTYFALQIWTIAGIAIMLPATLFFNALAICISALIFFPIYGFIYQHLVARVFKQGSFGAIATFATIIFCAHLPLLIITQGLNIVMTAIGALGLLGGLLSIVALPVLLAINWVSTIVALYLTQYAAKRFNWNIARL